MANGSHRISTGLQPNLPLRIAPSVCRVRLVARAAPNQTGHQSGHDGNLGLSAQQPGKQKPATTRGRRGRDGSIMRKGLCGAWCWILAVLAGVCHAPASPIIVSPDLDRDGQVSPADLAAFVSRWLADIGSGGASADVDGSGAVDPADVAAYIQLWLTGIQETSEGWTAYSPSDDSRIIFVSASLGSDLNSGFSPSYPVRSVAVGYSRLRDGSPDWLLLKRGDTFVREDFGQTIGNEFRKSGRSSSEPLLIGAYGTGPRPLLLTSDSGFVRGSQNGSEGRIVITGLAFSPMRRGLAAAGIQWQGGGGIDLVIDDCFIGGYAQNIVLQGCTAATVRRCVIVDANFLTTQVPAVGVYVSSCQQVVIDENVLDHNGWTEDGESPPSIFHHNVYVQDDNSTVFFRRNIVLNAGSHGVQLRCGGVIEDNLFVRNPISILLGGFGQGHQPLGVTGVIRGNVILEGSDMQTPEPSPRGTAIDLENISPAGVLIENNFIANKVSVNPDGFAFEFRPDVGVGVGLVTIRNNQIFNWRSGVHMPSPPVSINFGPIQVLNNRFQDPLSPEAFLAQVYAPSPAIHFGGNAYFSAQPASAWFVLAGETRSLAEWIVLMGEPGASGFYLPPSDPGRNLARYAGSLGLDPTTKSAIDALRSRRRGAWDNRLTTPALLQYFKVGLTP